MQHVSKTAQLNAAWNGVFELQLPWGRLAPQMAMSDWVNSQNIHAWTIKSDSNRCIGFTRSGNLAIRYLVRLLRDNDDRYVRRVSSSVLIDRLAMELRNRWLAARQGQGGQPDITSLEESLVAWLNSYSGKRTHFIPCAVIDEKAEPFSIGHLRFVHLESFDPANYGLQRAQENPFPLVRWMKKYDASWIGNVDVRDCEKSRSTEIAEVAIDLGLGAVQSFMRDPIGRNMARFTGRAFLSSKPSLIAHEHGHWTSGRRNTSPALGVTGKLFDETMKLASPDLARMGRLIDNFCAGEAKLPNLEQAWCDALFWFHEAVSEPLDTVAIAKLETAIENLFCAENTTKSKARMRQGFDYLLGMSRSALLDTTLPVTVGEFVEAVVTARSRILHGTWSTLAGRGIQVERRDVARLAQNFLLLYSRALDDYATSEPTPQDNLDRFLEWIRCTGAARPAGAGFFP